MKAVEGLAKCVLPQTLGAETLADALSWALRCDRRAHRRLVRAILPSLDGAAQLTAYLSQWLGRGRMTNDPAGRDQMTKEFQMTNDE